jgi:2-polyprenyl-6-methoxyphenol hydroxylase-like FAD-dependent oxidoreductase
MTARAVVGCDGGNSFVREALGVGQDDYGFSEPWMVCDFRFRRPTAVPPARQVGDPRRPTSIISLGPDHHRFAFMLDSAGDAEAEGAPVRVWERVSQYLTPDDAELIRVATYIFRSTVAHRWRTGRILLAGDGAHQMPPFLGQGMCSGIRDAQNLAFKLDLVLRGTAAALERAGVRVVPLSVDGPLADVDKTYQRWFAERDWSAVIVRPDFYVFGAAGADVEPRALAEDLLGALAQPL